MAQSVWALCLNTTAAEWCPGGLVEVSILVTQSLIGCVLNGFVFVMYTYRPQLRTLANRLVLNLMASNIMATVIVSPLRICIIVGCWSWASMLLPSAQSLVVVSGTFAVLFVSWDCYCAVMSPLHYAITITPRRVNAMIVCLWLCAILSTGSRTACDTMGYLYDCEDSANEQQFECQWKLSCLWYHSLFLSVCAFAIPCVFLCGLYTQMYLEAQKNSQKVRKRRLCSLTELSDSNIESTSTPSIPRASPSRNMLRKISRQKMSFSFFREEGKAMKTSFLVIFSFVFCWGPFFMGNLIESGLLPACIPFCPCISTILLLCASLILPCLFVFRRRSATGEVKQMVKMIFRRNQNKGLAECNRKLYQRQHSKQIDDSITISNGKENDTSKVLRSVRSKSVDNSVSVASSFVEPESPRSKLMATRRPSVSFNLGVPSKPQRNFSIRSRSIDGEYQPTAKQTKSSTMSYSQDSSSSSIKTDLSYVNYSSSSESSTIGKLSAEGKPDLEPCISKTLSLRNHRRSLSLHESGLPKSIGSRKQILIDLKRAKTIKGQVPSFRVQSEYPNGQCLKVPQEQTYQVKQKKRIPQEISKEKRDKIMRSDSVRQKRRQLLKRQEKVDEP